MDYQVKNENIRLPSDSSLIISDLLNKYGLKETSADLLGKIRKRQKTFRGSVAKIIRIASEDKNTLDNLPSIFEKELGLNKKDAKELTESLQKKILARVKTSALDEQNSLQREQKDATPKNPTEKSDAYREIV